MTHGVSDQVAIVTGAASGLGLAIANRLHAEGARVVMLDINEAAVHSAAKAAGDNASAFMVDVTNESQVSSVIERIGNELGRIDILVNSAGITGKTNVRSHEVDPADMRLVFNVNFHGSFLTSRAVLPWMLKRN